MTNSTFDEPYRQILVHSPGRVGSTTIISALSRARVGPCDLLHTHILNEETLIWGFENRPKEFLARRDVGYALVARATPTDSLERSIIVPIRSRLLRNASDFFWSRATSDMSVDLLLDDFLKNYPHEYVDTWLEQELTVPVGVKWRTLVPNSSGLWTCSSDWGQIAFVGVPNGLESLSGWLPTGWFREDLEYGTHLATVDERYRQFVLGLVELGYAVRQRDEGRRPYTWEWLVERVSAS
jgi:hypothetical protein